MLEKTKKFVSDHKPAVIASAIAAASLVTTALVIRHYESKTLLLVTQEVLDRLTTDPEKAVVGYDVSGVALGLFAIKPEHV